MLLKDDKKDDEIYHKGYVVNTEIPLKETINLKKLHCIKHQNFTSFLGVEIL